MFHRSGGGGGGRLVSIRAIAAGHLSSGAVDEEGRLFVWGCPFAEDGVEPSRADLYPREVSVTSINEVERATSEAAKRSGSRSSGEECGERRKELAAAEKRERYEHKETQEGKKEVPGGARSSRRKMSQGPCMPGGSASWRSVRFRSVGMGGYHAVAVTEVNDRWGRAFNAQFSGLPHGLVLPTARYAPPPLPQAPSSVVSSTSGAQGSSVRRGAAGSSSGGKNHQAFRGSGMVGKLRVSPSTASGISSAGMPKMSSIVDDMDSHGKSSMGRLDEDAVGGQANGSSGSGTRQAAQPRESISRPSLFVSVGISGNKKRN